MSTRSEVELFETSKKRATELCSEALRISDERLKLLATLESVKSKTMILNVNVAVVPVGEG